MINILNFTYESNQFISNINQTAKTQKIAYEFPELRCTFGDRSIVPDVAIFNRMVYRFR
jgi:hypothetical protein